MTAPPTAPSRRPPPRRAPTPRPGPWGWMELVGLAQHVLPALVFLPFVLGPVRTASRVLGFALALLAWLAVWQSGRRAVGRPFPAKPWLTVVACWMGLSILHPYSNSPLSAVAQALLVVSVVAPAFWVGALPGLTTARYARLLRGLLAITAAGTIVGILQFYYPGRFEPSYIPFVAEQPEEAAGLFYVTPDGRTVLRPCGLTDTPGAACISGSICFLLGLGLALQRRSTLPMRGVYLALAAAGLAVLHFSQVRTIMLTSLAAAVGMVALLVLRGEKRRALTLAVAGGVLFAAALGWALRSGGSAVVARFLDLFAGEGVVAAYSSNRGRFVENALRVYLPSYPLGAGLGRWGQPYRYFGIPRPYGAEGGPIWCEDQFSAWVVDGGVVVLVGYLGAIAAGLLAAVRVVRTTPDPDLALLGVGATAVAANTAVAILGAPVFVSPQGLVFWVLLAGLHATDQRVRADRRRAAAQAAAFPAAARAAAGAPPPGRPPFPAPFPPPRPR